MTEPEISRGARNDSDTAWRDAAGTFGFRQRAYNQAVKAARQIFDCSKLQRPGTLFVSSDDMAFAAMDVLRYEFGLRIPDRAAFVGYGVPAATRPACDLTTVRQLLPTMVTAAAERLLEWAETLVVAISRVKPAGRSFANPLGSRIERIAYAVADIHGFR